jgi:hypothetical protein
MSLTTALLLVGSVNLIAGGIGAYAGFRRIAARRVMRETLDELDRSAAALADGARPNGSEVFHGKRV